ncbi:hypothetical protein AB0E62_35540 [Streptomyces sp. NPDC038707]|uniref:hypothetical protein n=1 Tax=unclassified Streptomyces TaxID=2593676 RepID=UPI0033EEB837
MPLSDRHLTIRRDPDSEEVLARDGDLEAHSILQRAGFVPVHRLHETYHRAPAGLPRDGETDLATEAVARLRAAGYHVDCDADFDTDHRPLRYQTLGESVAHLSERLRQATTTDEAAEILTELTAPCDGILTAVSHILIAAAEFHDGLGTSVDPYTARRLRHLAEETLRVIHTDLLHTRNNLADRHAPHPGRTQCTREVPAGERERSAVCACPPPPRALPVPPPPMAAGPRR